MVSIVNRAVMCLLTGLAGALPAQDAPPPKPLELPGDWALRDVESKWVWYRQDRKAFASDPHRLKTWADELERRNDQELLEAIAIYEGWTHVGPALGRLKSPAWIRVAVWNHHSYNSHNKENARDWINRNKEEVLAWFEKYPIARRGPAKGLYRELLNQLGESGAETDALPPLEPHQILLPYLDAPKQLVEFGTRMRADPKERYVHQVLRALDGINVWGRADEMAAVKMFQLTGHAMRPIQVRAFDALSKLPPHLVPRRQLWRLAGDADATDFERSFAVLALATSNHPETELQLIVVAQDPDHPGWQNALQRLGDVGGPYAAHVLSQFAGPAAQNDGYHAARLRLKARLGADDRGRRVGDQAAVLQRVVWAERKGHAAAAELRTATVEWFAERFGDGGLRLHLESVLASPELGAYDPVLTATERNGIRRDLEAWLKELGG